MAVCQPHCSGKGRKPIYFTTPSAVSPRVGVDGNASVGGGGGNALRRLLFKACHDASAHWRTMEQLCPWRGLEADAFMARVFSGPSPLCLLLPQSYNISLWQTMNLIGSYSSLSGTAHQSYCLWVGVLWICVCACGSQRLSSVFLQ